MLRPTFARSQISDLDMIEDHTKNLIDCVRRTSQSAAIVDLQPLFFDLTLDASMELLFGESTSALAGKNPVGAAAFNTAFARSQEGAMNRARFGWLLTLWMDRKWKRDLETIHTFVEGLVERAYVRFQEGKSSTPDNRCTFADELFKRTSDRAQIRGKLLNVLLAGRDTTASLLSNV